MAAFASQLQAISTQVGFQMSARGWCYILENMGAITKGQFSRVENIINDCRKQGFLPIDFTAGDKSREFRGVEIPMKEGIESYFLKLMRTAWEADKLYVADWWRGEKYYIQMVVEKIDLVTLFEPIVKEYHIPIANSRGWSDINSRAEMAQRFKEAESCGLIPVLLVCGDLDPYGELITQKYRENFVEIQGGTGWNPQNLRIDRFGLNFDFIQENSLTWIDGLESSSGEDMAESDNQAVRTIVQRYIQKYGERKCEANALVVVPEKGRKLCRDAIEKYLGPDALARFGAKRDTIRTALDSYRRSRGISDLLNKLMLD